MVPGPDAAPQIQHFIEKSTPIGQEQGLDDVVPSALRKRGSLDTALYAAVAVFSMTAFFLYGVMPAKLQPIL